MQSYRGKGLAKKLLMKSEEIARNYHCKVSQLGFSVEFFQRIKISGLEN